MHNLLHEKYYNKGKTEKYIEQLYQMETVPVPIIDQNTQTQSYTHLRGV